MVRSCSSGGSQLEVIGVDDAIKKKPDLALFSAGGEFSRRNAERFAEIGCKVIDNSSAWRMEANIPLIVPEVNSGALRKDDRIIANPNCSTIQLVVALNKVRELYGIKRIVMSTYQAVSGSGKEALEQMFAERGQKKIERMAYPHFIDLNCIPHCDSFEDDGNTREENKLRNETIKIFEDPAINLTATCVRVPVISGHSEAVNVETVENFHMESLRKVITSTPGVMIIDEPENSLYPMPLMCTGRDEVLVGRLRRDYSADRAFNAWIVSDNLRKGAATNAVQIAELLLSRGWL